MVPEMGGTLAYISPEALRGVVDFCQDMWALGCTMYELLYQKPPFGEIPSHDRSPAGPYDPIFSTLTFPEAQSEDEGRLQNLIRQLLVVNPSERLTVEALIENTTLAHYARLFGLSTQCVKQAKSIQRLEEQVADLQKQLKDVVAQYNADASSLAYCQQQSQGRHKPTPPRDETPLQNKMKAAYDKMLAYAQL